MRVRAVVNQSGQILALGQQQNDGESGDSANLGFVPLGRERVYTLDLPEKSTLAEIQEIVETHRVQVRDGRPHLSKVAERKQASVVASERSAADVFGHVRATGASRMEAGSQRRWWLPWRGRGRRSQRPRASR